VSCWLLMFPCLFYIVLWSPRDFLFTTTFRLALEPTLTPVKWVQGSFVLAVKWWGHAADHTPPSKASLGGGQAGQLSRVTSCKWHQDITGIVRNLMLVHWGFPHVKNFSKNYPQFGHAPSKTFTSPVLGRKEIDFKEPVCWPAHGAHVSQVSPPS
jgi:hypothetical protein